MSVGAGSGAAAMLGRYRLVHPIGEGGMGVVHLALDPAGRAVALKVLRSHIAADPDARARLAREVATLQRVQHPRIAEVLDADVDGDRPFIVTQYVPGQSLDDRVRAGGALAGEPLVALGRGLAAALQAIHAAGVVHRDLKPGNVLILDGQPMVIDFGIAHVADDVRLTSTGLVMGTPGYLSPEVLAGDDVSTATDWWGWAATMVFAATGRPPFGRGPVEVVMDRVRRGEADLEGVDSALRPVLGSALAVRPADRPGPRTLLAGLEAYAEVVLRDADTTALVIIAPAAGQPDSERPPSDRSGSEAATASLPVVQSAPPTAPLDVVRTAPLTPVPAAPPRQRHQQAPAPSAQPPLYSQPAPHAQPPTPYTQPPAPYTQPPAARLPARSGRVGTLTAGLVALCAVAAVAPLVAALVGAAGMVLSRTVDRTMGAMWRRRYERGPRRSDHALSALGAPWHFVMAVLVSVPALILPVLVAVSAAFLTGAVLGSVNAPAPGRPLALAAAFAAASLTAWWGPGGGSLRRGSRTIVRTVAPGHTGAVVATGMLALIVLAGVLVVLQQGGQPDWSPLNGPPFGVAG